MAHNRQREELWEDREPGEGGGGLGEEVEEVVWAVELGSPVVTLSSPLSSSSGLH